MLMATWLRRYRDSGTAIRFPYERMADGTALATFFVPIFALCFILFYTDVVLYKKGAPVLQRGFQQKKKECLTARSERVRFQKHEIAFQIG